MAAGKVEGIAIDQAKPIEMLRGGVEAGQKAGRGVVVVIVFWWRGRTLTTNASELGRLEIPAVLGSPPETAGWHMDGPNPPFPTPLLAIRLCSSGLSHPVGQTQDGPFS